MRSSHHNETGSFIMSRIVPVFLLLIATALAPARATVISYDAAPVAGNTWLYSYEITNTGSASIEEFTLFFDRALFTNLSVVSVASGWSPFIAQPDPFLPDDGLFDAFAETASPLEAGATLGGFSVRFDFLGLGAPGAQLFDILRSEPFAIVESGRTQARGEPLPVAEPPGLALAVASLLLLGAGAWTRRREKQGA